MGGKSTKDVSAAADAVANGNGQHHNNNNKSRSYYMPEPEDSNMSNNSNDCNCFLFSWNSSKDNLLSQKTKKQVDTMGTPIPDTPLDQRRQRRRLLLQQEENFQKQQQAPRMLSRYGGLEKEPSTRYSSLSQMSSESLLRAYESEPPAQVHEGEDAERLLFQKYDLLEVLGVGSTSMCHRCVCRETGVEYACKIIDKQIIQDKFQGMMEQFHREISALRSLRHPNIIRLYDVYVTQEKIYIVMELMEGGELFDYVVEKGTLNEEEASRIVRKVTSALVYMHSKDIVHRDLKPENLLLLHKPNSAGEHLEVKIIDFGLSKCMVEPVARSFLGTRGYLAPEMLQRRDYSQAVDTWALGVICFVLLCGCLPFDDDSQTVPSDALVKAKFVLRFPRWAKNLSQSAKDLLSHLLDINPKTRYTAEQALEHEWTRGKTALPENLLASPGRLSYRKSPGMNNGGKPPTTTSKPPQHPVYPPHARHRRQGSSGTPTRVLVRKTSI